MDGDKPAKPTRFPSKLRLFSRHSFGMEFSRILTLFNEDMFQVKKAHLRGGARERKLAARAGEAGSKHHIQQHQQPKANKADEAGSRHPHMQPEPHQQRNVGGGGCSTYQFFASGPAVPAHCLRRSGGIPSHFLRDSCFRHSGCVFSGAPVVLGASQGGGPGGVLIAKCPPISKKTNL